MSYEGIETELEEAGFEKMYDFLSAINCALAIEDFLGGRFCAIVGLSNGEFAFKNVH